MLMEVKNQISVCLLSIKYALEREMLNKVSFLSNVFFMILNNASFLVQWVVLLSIKGSIGSFTMKEIFLLWGIASGTYGVSHFFFEKAYSLSETITEGSLDTFLVQPKNVLLSVITSDIKTSAIGDLIFALVMVILYDVRVLPLYTLFCITGGLILTSIAIIFSSLSFWIVRSDMIADNMNSSMIMFSTYPGDIFKGGINIILYSILPVGIVNYLPVSVLREFNLMYFIILVVVCILFISSSYIIFNRGLRRYSSSNLMNARI